MLASAFTSFFIINRVIAPVVGHGFTLAKGMEIGIHEGYGLLASEAMPKITIQMIALDALQGNSCH
jgi:hypothetical protein